MNRAIVSEIHKYKSDAKSVANLVKGLSNTHIQFKINSKEWNINQIIVHLADTEMFFCERMRKIIVEERPQLQSFEQDDWANGLWYGRQDYKLSLKLLIAQREVTAGLLQLLPSRVWERKGIKDGKEVTVYDIFSTALHHIPTHIEQIKKIMSHPEFQLVPGK